MGCHLGNLCPDASGSGCFTIGCGLESGWATARLGNRSAWPPGVGYNKSGPPWNKRPFSTIIHYVDWSPDGTRVVGGGDDGCLYLWGIADGTLLQRLPGHQGMATRVVWSPDGTRLASCGSSSDTGELFVWDVQSGERLQTFAGHPGIVYAAVWTPRGDLLVSGGSDGILRWWEVQSGKCLRMRAAHEGTVLSLRKSPDGKLLASCGDDGAIHLWELKRDRKSTRLNSSHEWISYAVFCLK